MALVVLLRGVNVGGHRAFRPSELVSQLKHLDVVNIGAAGTFVVRRRVTHSQARAEFARRLPFEAEITIRNGREIVALMSEPRFGNQPLRPGTVRFVSVFSRRPRTAPPLPMRLPGRGRWLLTILACDTRFAVGMYRRDMKTIGCLGALDRVFGAPVTTRNWNTMAAIARVLADA